MKFLFLSSMLRTGVYLTQLQKTIRIQMFSGVLRFGWHHMSHRSDTRLPHWYWRLEIPSFRLLFDCYLPKLFPVPVDVRYWRIIPCRPTRLKPTRLPVPTPSFPRHDLSVLLRPRPVVTIGSVSVTSSSPDVVASPRKTDKWR